ncbi:pirin family protein [Dactylosporangium roseum]|uniref:Pirin family protein n=1 Tax=Dactylosporangium roseum TaxID=47989 RepID=A0ABY5Z004_9ACTN|nr:pirin family protein [Dactylosporangium roseum]UWZ35117.1 pirin family protein [Dactylosporangium roseum]
MSNLESLPAEVGLPVETASAPCAELLEGRDVPLGRYTVVRRSLPNKTRRTVGAWCFLDHFGPEDITGGPGMRVPPHPHIGLQTVTWLLGGEVRHRDSLGSDQVIRPGQLNIMTAGRGIAHSENSPTEHPPLLHGLQLWVALPDDSRHVDPSFQHLPDLPVVETGGARVTVAVGELGGASSPAVVHSELLGADLALTAGASATLGVRHDFEHAVVVTEGTVSVEGVPVSPGSLLYLGALRDTLRFEADGEARCFLLGGVPFEEELVMWWNFVARSHEEIVAARTAWTAADTSRFAPVPGGEDPLPAPALPTTRLLPRPRYRPS